MLHSTTILKKFPSTENSFVTKFCVYIDRYFSANLMIFLI